MSLDDSLRLRLSPTVGQGALDGGWWPRSHDLAAGLADLAVLLPARPVHVTCSGVDWTRAPDTLHVAGGEVSVDLRPDGDDAGVMTVGLADGQVLRLAVLPPESTPSAVRHVLRLASDPANHAGAGELLAEAASLGEGEEADERWDDEGGARFALSNAPDRSERGPGATSA